MFIQLPTDYLRDYELIINEITSQFRVIESPQVYVDRFNSRDQKPNEKIGEHVAELKSLFWKGFTPL